MSLKHFHFFQIKGLAALAKANEWSHNFKMHMERVISFEASYGSQYTSHSNEDHTTPSSSNTGYDGFVQHNVRIQLNNSDVRNYPNLEDELQSDQPNDNFGKHKFSFLELKA